MLSSAVCPRSSQHHYVLHGQHASSVETQQSILCVQYVSSSLNFYNFHYVSSIVLYCPVCEPFIPRIIVYVVVVVVSHIQRIGCQPEKNYLTRWYDSSARPMGVASQNSTLPCAIATLPVSLPLSSPGDVWPRLPLLPSTWP